MNALKLILIFFLSITICSCSNNDDDSGNPHWADFHSGRDLFSELSQEEKTLIGKWYFAYRTDELVDGKINNFYDSHTFYADQNQKDTLIFYSREFVGQNPQFGCLENNPPNLSGKQIKLIEPRSPHWFNYCFPFGYGGWLIENDEIVYYRGYNIDDILKYPIEELNSDSLVFDYTNVINSSLTVKKKTATFYKK